MAPEGVESVDPQAPVRLEPLIKLDHALKVHGVDPPLGVRADTHQNRVAQTRRSLDVAGWLIPSSSTSAPKR